MKTSLLSLILLLAFIGSADATITGGSGVGNGTDHTDPTKVITWFMDSDRPIQWCVEVAKDVKEQNRITKPFIEKAFLASIESWHKYIQYKGVFKGVKKQLTPSMTYVRQRNCFNPDLKIIMGDHPESKKYRKQYENPLAFAQVTKVESKIWRKGIIWLKSDNPQNLKEPNWGLSFALQGILTHELGHILGNEHVPLTLMDKDFHKFVLPAPILLNPPFLRKLLATNIDHHHELSSCIENCNNYFYGLLEAGRNSGTVRPRHALEWMFNNFWPEFNTETHELRLAMHQKGEKFDLWLLALTPEGLRKKTVPVKIEYKFHQSSRGEIKTFKRLDRSGILHFSQPLFMIYEASMTNSKGKKFAIKLKKNDVNDGIISMDFRINDQFENLFMGSVLKGAEKHYQTLRESLSIEPGR